MTFEAGIEAEKMKLSVSTQTDTVYESKGIQTDITLKDQKYDTVFSNQDAINQIQSELSIRNDLLMKSGLLDQINFNPLKPSECSQQFMSLMKNVLKPSIEKHLKMNPSLNVMNPLLVLSSKKHANEEYVNPDNRNKSRGSSRGGRTSIKKRHQNLPGLTILPAQDHNSTVNDLTVDLGSATDVDKNGSLSNNDEMDDRRVLEDASESPIKEPGDQEVSQGGFAAQMKVVERQSKRSRRSSVAVSKGSITQTNKLRINLGDGANSCVNSVSRNQSEIGASPKTNRSKKASTVQRKSHVPSQDQSKARSRRSSRLISTSPRSKIKIKLKADMETATPRRKAMLRKSLTVEIGRSKLNKSMDDDYNTSPIDIRHSISKQGHKPEFNLDIIQEAAHGEHDSSPMKKPDNRRLLQFQLQSKSASKQSSHQKLPSVEVSQKDIGDYSLQVDEVYRKLTADNFKVYDVLAMLLYAVSFEVNKYGIYDKLLKDMRIDLESKSTELELVKLEHSKCKSKIDNLTEQIQNSPQREDMSLVGKEEHEKSVLHQEFKVKKPGDDLKSKIQEFTDLLAKRDGDLGTQSHARQLMNILSTGRFTQFKNPMPLKAVLKSISTIYSEKYKDNLKAADLRRQNQTFEEYVYEYYMQYFGIKDIADKKFCYFILSLKYHALYFRVNMFSRFMGLIPGFRYNQDQINKYIEGMQYLETSNKGYSVKNADSSTRVYFPYLRAEDYIKTVFDKKLSLEELYELKKKVEDCKEEDTTGRNTALIDGDVFLEKIIEKYGSLINRTKQYVVDAFDSCDIDGNKTCSVNEWVLLYRYLEPESFELSSCIKMFFENANKYVKGEHCMNFDKFAVICTDKGLFNEEKQNQFIQAINGTSIEEICQTIRLNWTVRHSELQSKLANIQNLTEDEMGRWQQNLQVLNHQFIGRSTLSDKSIAIAYYLTAKELDRMKHEEEMFEKQYDD